MGKKLGDYGEYLARGILEKEGYVILERNYRTRYGELDLVAGEGETLVFIEVKTRTGQSYGSSAAALTRTKQRHMIRAALSYLSYKGYHGYPCRFDLLDLRLDKKGKLLDYQLFRNAFVLERGKNC